jgi:ribonuclease BN (tRNA processing enzyme)
MPAHKLLRSERQNNCFSSAADYARGYGRQLKRMQRFLLNCFGVGDGWPSAERSHSAFLYRFKTSALLVDCGEPVSRTFKASGLDYDLIDHLFLSHLHFDHVGGFFMLIQSFWLEGRKKELHVHAPADGIGPLRETLRAGCLFDELLPFRLRFEPLKTSQAVEAGQTRVTPFPTTHLSHLRDLFRAKYPQAYEAFCFLIESDDCRIAHSADLGAAEDLAPLLEKPVDLLVCELAHMDPEELFPFLRARPIGRICFIHLSRDCRGRLGEVQALAKDMLKPIPVSFAEDGDEFGG